MSGEGGALSGIPDSASEQQNVLLLEANNPPGASAADPAPNGDGEQLEVRILQRFSSLSPPAALSFLQRIGNLFASRFPERVGDPVAGLPLQSQPTGDQPTGGALDNILTNNNNENNPVLIPQPTGTERYEPTGDITLRDRDRDQPTGGANRTDNL
ncbi:hypothetical protein Vretimale_18731, partial [Volvox reticuliferus]